MGPFEDPVLNAALSCFEAHTWRDVTPALVEDVSGQPVPAEIRTPDDLAAAILRGVLEKLPRELEDELEPGAPLRERLFALTANVLRILDGSKGFVRALLREAFERPGASFTRTEANGLVRLAEQQIEEAQRAGEIAPWVMTSIAARAYLAVHLRVVAFWVLDNSAGSELSYNRADKWLSQLVWAMGGKLKSEAT